MVNREKARQDILSRVERDNKCGDTENRLKACEQYMDEYFRLLDILNVNSLNELGINLFVTASLCGKTYKAVEDLEILCRVLLAKSHSMDKIKVARGYLKSCLGDYETYLRLKDWEAENYVK